ncbi:dTMP kinase [Malacoplasma penetrans]|uniref:Thymidylate kinase n=1 Tax=Malacoplasma penetrans (strain HF-2) TaxID=272633 RepID=KTHY_MALP2|nr:dTMP kinase [Malacoplasma penetrans]Q8EUV4.1 RecName: Full=Thymidylate kinase; AltName: Full=dTMP kinase [Malacoplasma penetrans HF-2]RXY96462.1 dTMP kinase [Malacoplasma penetrans]BAC44607.1 thymidylate kinase [Malacoplasma penetrans HF-2]
MQLDKGLFVAFEGPDACGKSTVSKLVYQKLINFFNNKDSVILTREPGGTEVGEKIREILVNYDIDPRTEALLFAASRTEHVWNVILKAKANKKIILCDRFIHSSLVYQGIVKNLGYKNVYKVNQFGISKIKPDIVFYFSANPKVLLERKTKDKDRDIFDRLDNQYAQEENLKKIIGGYSSILQFDNRNVIRLDALKPVEELANKICATILERVR